MATQFRRINRRKPKQSRSKELVRIILDATAQVLISHGYHGASTNRIAARAGVSVGSIYQYFSDKDAIIAALIETLADRAEKQVSHRALSMIDAPFAIAMRATIEAVMTFLRSERKLIRALLEHPPAVGDTTRLASMEQRLIAIGRVYLIHHRSELDLQDLEAAHFVVVNVVSLLCSRIVLDRPPELSQERLAAEVTRMLVRYLCPPDQWTSL